MVENPFNKNIKIFHNNGGWEFDTDPLKLRFNSCGMSFRKSYYAIPKQKWCCRA